MDRCQSSANTNRVALTGMLFAMSLVLSLVEASLPVLPAIAPGVKLGLSNIVTMYTLFTLGFGSGVSIAVLKSLFVLFTRGLVACSLSFFGGVCAICLMWLLQKLPSLRSQFILVSILGAVAHNFGQMVIAVLVTQTAAFFYMLPILFLSGVCMGAVTGVVVRTILPYIKKV